MTNSGIQYFDTLSLLLPLSEGDQSVFLTLKTFTNTPVGEKSDGGGGEVRVEISVDRCQIEFFLQRIKKFFSIQGVLFCNYAILRSDHRKPASVLYHDRRNDMAKRVCVYLTTL